MLDRFQPYFWTRTRARKRPCTLHVVGEGGDPHGFDPLVGCVRSAAAVAGFRLERVLDWVGKIDESGEIVDEADEYPVEGPVVRAFAGGQDGRPGRWRKQELPAEDEPAEQADEFEPEAFAEDDFAAQLASQAQRRQNRARLNLARTAPSARSSSLTRTAAASMRAARSQAFPQKKHANAKRGIERHGAGQAREPACP